MIWGYTMSFCTKCGKELFSGDKFCSGCGTTVGRSAFNSPFQRRQEYAGRILKCPACGMEIPSLTAYCPGCGHEINSAEVSVSIRDFVEKINEYDDAISRSPAEPQKGWNSWGKAKKFGWVILNLYTLCIPLVIYLLLPLLGIGGTRAFTAEEKQKVTFIKNYTFPNDRETILEVLLFIQTQMNFLSTGKKDRNSVRWARVWKSKADQLYHKAEIMFSGDKISNEAYGNILQDNQKIRKSIQMRIIAAIVLVFGFVIFVSIRSGVVDNVKKANATFNWPTSGMAALIPEPDSNKGEITYNDDDRFWAEVNNVSQEQYEAYIVACQEKGFVIESEKSSITYKAYNENGYCLELTQYRSSTELRIKITSPMEMTEIRWPSSDIAKSLPTPKSNIGNIYWENENGFVIYIGNTTPEDYAEYVNACMDNGFAIKYEKGDTYYRADNKDGYHISIEYRGFNIMFIRIDD